MRFGSIRAFLSFLQALQGMGLTISYPFYEIEEGLRRLPDYISNYNCIIMWYGNFLNIQFVRNKSCYYSLSMKKGE